MNKNIDYKLNIDPKTLANRLFNKIKNSKD